MLERGAVWRRKQESTGGEPGELIEIVGTVERENFISVGPQKFVRIKRITGPMQGEETEWAPSYIENEFQPEEDENG